jgi:hypothetical protein
MLTRTRILARGLFKPDHPRAIDRYIDYFGAATSQADPCGERLLDCLEADDARAGDVPRAAAG